MPHEFTTAALNADKVFALFDTAKRHLKQPVIRFTVDGTPLRFKQSAKYPDVIWINGSCFGMTYGRLERSGLVHFTNDGRRLTNLPLALAVFVRDPVKVTADFGRLTNSCCYCARQLTDVRSTEAGYGPICAVHYGLPWGEYESQGPEMTQHQDDWVIEGAEVDQTLRKEDFEHFKQVLRKPPARPRQVMG